MKEHYGRSHELVIKCLLENGRLDEYQIMALAASKSESNQVGLKVFLALFVLVPRQLTFLPWSECYCLFQPRYLFRKLPSSSPSEVASHSDVPFATRSLRKTRCRSIDRSRTSAYIHQPQRNTIFHTLRVVSA